jgi:hypothetical protein
MTIWIR